MNTILTALVGSRAHGLHGEGSDYDWRGIFTVPLKSMLSPFDKVKTTSWIEGDVDDTSYELTHIIKGCCQCNPNMLEVMYSPEITFDDVELGAKIIENRHKFLDKQRIFDSHRGFAANQYKKMSLLDPDARTPKFAVAYIRALHNGAGLLRTGHLNIAIQDEQLLADLRAIKYHFNDNKALAMRLFTEKNQDIIDAYTESTIGEADTAFWEDFIVDYYKTQ